MWKALGMWQVGWFVGLLGGKFMSSGIPERILPATLGCSLMGGIVGALLGAILVVKGLDDNIVLGIFLFRAMVLAFTGPPPRQGNEWE